MENNLKICGKQASYFIRNIKKMLKRYLTFPFKDEILFLPKHISKPHFNRKKSDCVGIYVRCFNTMLLTDFIFFSIIKLNSLSHVGKSRSGVEYHDNTFSLTKKHTLSPRKFVTFYYKSYSMHLNITNILDCNNI